MHVEDKVDQPPDDSYVHPPAITATSSSDWQSWAVARQSHRRGTVISVIWLRGVAMRELRARGGPWTAAKPHVTTKIAKESLFIIIYVIGGVTQNANTGALELSLCTCCSASAVRAGRVRHAYMYACIVIRYCTRRVVFVFNGNIYTLYAY